VGELVVEWTWLFEVSVVDLSPPSSLVGVPSVIVPGVVVVPSVFPTTGGCLPWQRIRKGLVG
jgi:hypothetical protein